MKFTELKAPNNRDLQFYAVVGHAIRYLQGVEDGLNCLITIKRDWREPGNITESQVYEVLEMHRKNTLGTTLNMARQARLFDEKVLKRFYDFKNERDWLIHSSFQNRDDLDAEGEQSRLLERLESFLQEAWVLTNVLDVEISDFVETFGITREQIDEAATGVPPALNKLAIGPYAAS